jgi:hypothetical protein
VLLGAQEAGHLLVRQALLVAVLATAERHPEDPGVLPRRRCGAPGRAPCS